MNIAKIVKLPVAAITITIYENGAGNVTSNLQSPFDDDHEPQTTEDLRKNTVYDTTLDTLYTILQSHVTAGLDVTTPAYLQGIANVVTQLQEQLSI